MTTCPPFLVLIGTKAQFIKTAPILREMDLRGLPYTLVYTGQHSETFELLERTFATRPAQDVVVRHEEAATSYTFLRWSLLYWLQILRRIARGAWKAHRLAVVHGDTASTLFGAIAARLSGIPVAHIEAGLRSPRVFDPFPEEIIRRLVSRLAILHFAPDAKAALNLRKTSGRVLDTEGNTLRDALRLALKRYGDLPPYGGHGGYGVVSLHRSENLQKRRTFDLLMEEIVYAANITPLRFVLHPATRARLRATGWAERLESVPNLELMERVDYPDFVRLLIESNFLLTDGGSNQEEAAMLGLPTLLLRRVTEREDGLGDVVEISGLERDAIRSYVNRFAGKTWPIRLVSASSPSEKIVDALLSIARATA